MGRSYSVKKKKFTTEDKERMKWKDKHQQVLGELMDRANGRANSATGRKLLADDRRQDETVDTVTDHADQGNGSIIDNDDEWETEEAMDDEMQHASSDSSVPVGYRLVDMRALDALVTEAAACRHCGGELRLEEDSTRCCGGASFLILRCENPNCTGPCVGKWTRQTTGGSNSRIREINKLSVLAMRAVGKGQRGAAVFAGHINMPVPITRDSWKRHTNTWGGTAHEMLQDDFER